MNESPLHSNELHLLHLKEVVSRSTGVLWIFGLMILLLISSCTKVEWDSPYFEPVPAHYFEDLPFEMTEISIPEFPDRSVNIRDYGAVDDGETLNTESINQAIKEVSDMGGGKVVIPRGIWLTGPIVLQSNVNLHVEKGALVLFSDNFDLYPLVETVFEGLDTWRAKSPIYAKGVENIAITGAGVFDGNGDAWRQVERHEVTESHWNSLLESGGVLSDDGQTWYPSQSSKLGDPGNFNVPQNRETKADFEEVKDFLRPVMVSVRESKNILLDGPTFQNSPAWNVHPLMSENIILRNLTIRNPEYAKNGDALDLESSRNAVIYNNTFDAGDDGICIKSGKNEDGRRRGMPTENVVIRDNLVLKAHGGFVVGSEMSGGVRNIHVSNMTFIGTDVGVRFKSTRGRGGVVENIFIEDIHMQNIVTEPLRFNLYYDGEAPSINQKVEIVDKKKLREEIPEVSVETPQFRNIHLKNIFSSNSQTAMWVQGLPEMNIQNLTFENVRLTAKNGGMILDTDQISMNNVEIKTSKSPVLYLKDVKNLETKKVRFSLDENVEGDTGLRIEGVFTDSLSLQGVDFFNIGQNVSIGPNVDEETIKVSGGAS